jgi:hypothetical protein
MAGVEQGLLQALDLVDLLRLGDLPTEERTRLGFAKDKDFPPAYPG